MPTTGEKFWTTQHRIDLIHDLAEYGFATKARSLFHHLINELIPQVWGSMQNFDNCIYDVYKTIKKAEDAILQAEEEDSTLTSLRHLF